MRSTEVASAIVRVDATQPEVTLEGAPRGLGERPGAADRDARPTPSRAWPPSGPSGPFTAIAIDGGVPTGEPAARRPPRSSAARASHSVAFYARDAAGNVRRGELRHRPTVRIDETPPRVAFAAAQDPADPERIEATVSDPLSGPDPTRGSIAVRPAGLAPALHAAADHGLRRAR